MNAVFKASFMCLISSNVLQTKVALEYINFSNRVLCFSVLDG